MYGLTVDDNTDARDRLSFHTIENAVRKLLPWYSAIGLNKSKSWPLTNLGHPATLFSL
jgi:hypothetical protein